MCASVWSHSKDDTRIFRRYLSGVDVHAYVDDYYYYYFDENKWIARQKIFIHEQKKNTVMNEGEENCEWKQKSMNEQA